MTVSTTQNRISYNGDASSTVFSFPYKFLATSDLKVYVGGVLQIITTDYAVGTPSDSGANVTFVLPPATGVANIVIVREADLLQQAALKSNGKFPAETVEDMVDKVTLIAQRLEDKFDQSLVVPDDETLSATLPDQATRAGMYLSFDVNGDPEVVNAVVDINTVAGIASDITTVSGIAAAVSTVAGISADVSAVAANAANINTVAGIDADVTTVAGIAADVTAVVAISAEVIIAADNVADITNFADVYQGGKAADPMLRNDSSALQTGDLYFNTTADEMRVYDGVNWLQSTTAEAASFTADTFNGTGAQTAFTLSATPGSIQSLIVFISGVRQTPTTDYTYSGTTLNFVAAPPAGTGNITTLVVATLAAGVPDNGSVTAIKLSDNVFSGLTQVTPSAADFIPIADTADTGNKKKALLSDILSLAQAFASGTRMVFNQTAAPTGWTKDTTAALNDSIMRIVTGTVGSGGATAFSTFNGQTSVGATTLSTNEMPSHQHNANLRGAGATGGNATSIALQGSSGTLSFITQSITAQGGGGSHTHSITTSIKYNDFIIASKD